MNLAARIIPAPRTVEAVPEQFLLLRDGCSFRLNTPVPPADAAERVRTLARTAWNIRPDVTVLPGADDLPEEAYRLTVTPDACEISAATDRGLRYALATLRQLAEAERGTLRSPRFELPAIRITDEPALAFRGIHLCLFPEHELWETERRIRLAAYYKFNTVILESWGMIRYDSHPEFAWDHAFSKDDIRHLLDVANDVGITLVPQLNLFGHATQARSGTGKHVVLDRFPELAPLFEPDGWSFCLSNPNTRTVLHDLVDELVDLFRNPPLFHIGCDEAYNAGSCRCCETRFPEKLRDHIRHFHDYLAARGCTVMMWHDMLLDKTDPRWKGYVACGDSAHELRTLRDELPRDILLCDWQYGYPEKDGREPDWPTVRFFRDLGFPVIPCPWLNRNGTRSLGKLAASEKLPGILMTTWHANETSFRYTAMYAHGACAAWNPLAPLPDAVLNEFLNKHVRDISRDMNLREYRQFGTAHEQVARHSVQGL